LIGIEGIDSLNSEERRKYLGNTQENDVLKQLKTISHSPNTQGFSKEDRFSRGQPGPDF
jgi:uncharacterized protein YueI